MNAAASNCSKTITLAAVPRPDSGNRLTAWPTYFAVDGDSSEALKHWLRRAAFYLGNENYPWFQKNPAWNNLRTNSDFERILEDLKKSFRKNQKTWKRLLDELPVGE